MKIIIIGAEAAGASAASKAKRLAPEAEIVIYEKSEITSFGACGLPYFVGDCFSDANFMISRTVEQFKDNGIQVKTKHEVISVDTQSKRVTVKDLTTGTVMEDGYDRLMIATGAIPVIPPIENLALQNVFTLKTLEDGIALKQAAQSPDVKEVVIIGAGFIGIEVAEAMKSIGKSVRVIQLDERVLSDVFDKEITAVLEKEIEASGIHLHVGECVKALRGNQVVHRVVTDKGEYPADLVVVAVGVKPSTDFLKTTGIEMLKNGAILINAFGQTNVPEVYAAGDCASVYHLIREESVYIPLATTANKIGKLVGENLTGKSNAFPGTLGTAAIRFMEMEAGRSGLTETEAINMGIPYSTVFVRDKNHSNYLPGQEDVFVKLIYHQQTRNLLGGQVIGGSGAALRANILAVAIWNVMTVEQLGTADLLYAPPFSRPWDVLSIAANAAK